MKYRAIALAALFLVSMLSIESLLVLPMNEALAVGPVTVVNDAYSVGGVGGYGDHALFKAATRLWYWYVNSANRIAHSTSTDSGATWAASIVDSSATPVCTNQSVGFFYDSANNKFFWACTQSGGTNIFYRWGTPQSDGTMSWQIAEGSFSEGQASGGTTAIAATSSEVWITDQVSGTVKAWQSTSLSSPSWTSRLSTATGAGAQPVHLVAYSNGKFGVSFQASGKEVFYDYGNGANMPLKATTTSSVTDDGFGSGSSVSVGTNHYMSILSGTTLKFFTHAYNGTSAPTETTVEASTVITGHTSLSTDANSDFIIEGQASSANKSAYGYVSTDGAGNTWAARVLIQSTDQLKVDTLTSSYLIDGNTVYTGYQNQTNTLGRFVSYAFAGFTVTQPITCKLQESGATNETATLSGGSPSPSTITCSSAGTTTNVSVNPSATITVTVQADNPNTRFRGNASWTTGQTFSFAACGSGTCPGKLLYNYYQLQNTYKATPTSPTLFDVAKTLPVNGTILGAANTNICNIVTANGGGAASCAGWSDFNLTASFTSTFTVSGHTWATSDSVSFRDTTGGNTHNANFREGFTVNAYYSVSDILGGCAAPILSYTYNGTLRTLTLTTSPVSTPADLGTSWSTTNPILVGGGNERCIAKTGTSGTIQVGRPISPAYEHQWKVTFLLSGVNPYQVPTTIFQNGTNVIVNENNSPATQWAKGGSQVVLSNPVAINGNSQLYTYNPTSYAIVAATTISNLYFVQSIAPLPTGNCIETNTCPPMLPLDFLVFPYKSFMGDFALPIIWGAVLTMLYIKTENAMLVLGVGIGILAGMYQFVPSLLQASSTSIIFFWAISAAGVGVGSTLFYLYKHKVQQP